MPTQHVQLARFVRAPGGHAQRIQTGLWATTTASALAIPAPRATSSWNEERTSAFAGWLDVERVRTSFF